MTTSLAFPTRSEHAPHTWGSAVYGVMLNHRPAFEAYANAMHEPPYRAPPQHPVLYIKPGNTHCGDGPITVPDGHIELEYGPCLALVMGSNTRDCPPEKALTKVAGLLTVADVRIPHQNLYRPSIPMIARDGFCPMAKRMTRLSDAGDPDQLGVRVWIDGQLIHVTSTADRLRNAAQLVAALSQTMTLQEGDLVLMGVSHGAPRVRPGQSASITIDGLEPLDNVFVMEKAGA